MLANAARASRALDDDAHEISTRRLAYWRRAHRRAQKTNVGAASGKTDLNHISYFHRFHTSLNMMMRDDFDHHRGTPPILESRSVKSAQKTHWWRVKNGPRFFRGARKCLKFPGGVVQISEGSRVCDDHMDLILSYLIIY